VPSSPLLDAEVATGITLTESLSMSPASSVSGFYYAHPDSRYFAVGQLGDDQLADYAARTGATVDELRRWLGCSPRQTARSGNPSPSRFERVAAGRSRGCREARGDDVARHEVRWTELEIASACAQMVLLDGGASRRG
jgi:hypothetical protein